MRIAFIVAVFPPEPEPAAVMANELTRAWAAAGHQVTVISPTPNRPTGTVYPGFQRQLRDRRLDGSRTVTRTWSWQMGPERRSVDRILENISFGLTSALELAAAGRPDVVIVESWPILAYLPALAVSALRGIPLVNYVQDVYPEAGISGGQIRSGSITAEVLRTLDRLVCSRATKNVVVSQGMLELLARARALPRDRFVVLENWLDLAAIRPTATSTWRTEVDLAGKDFVALFAGTMGFASGVDVLVDAASILREHAELKLVCVGDGVLKKQMAAEIGRRGLSNLKLLPFQPRERIADVQSAADVAVLTTAPGVGSSSVPSKLITYLAAGRPVVCAVKEDSDTARIVGQERLGLVVPPGDARALAAALLELRRMDPADRAAMGRRARETAERRFSLESAVARFSKLFQELGLERSPGE
jgi:colanic acid biosynthesis glycosyl transferase WcaI